MSTEEGVTVVHIKQEVEEEVVEDNDCHACHDSTLSVEVKEPSLPDDCVQGKQGPCIKVEEVTDWGYGYAKSVVAENPTWACVEDKEEQSVGSSEDTKAAKVSVKNKKPAKMCGECNATFTCSASLRRHQVLHEEDSWLRCEECGREFSRRVRYEEHVRAHSGYKPYSCKICGHRFVRSDVLRRHLLTHTNERPHKCDMCPAAFRQPEQLKRHKRYHNGERPFECQQCSQRFTQSTDLTRHLRSHTGERPYPCPYCPKTFAVKHCLKRHLGSHEGIKPFPCEFCGRAFSRRYLLVSHIKSKHNNAAPTTVEDEAESAAAGSATTDFKGGETVESIVKIEPYSDHDDVSDTSELSV